MSACPKCNYFSSEVEMTRRLRNGWIKRYRTCTEEKCGHKYITFELPGDEIDLPNNPLELREISLRKAKQ